LILSGLSTDEIYERLPIFRHKQAADRNDHSTSINGLKIDELTSLPGAILLRTEYWTGDKQPNGDPNYEQFPHVQQILL